MPSLYTSVEKRLLITGFALSLILFGCMDRRATARKLVGEGDKAMKVGHADKAVVMYRRAINSDPHNPDAFMGLANAAFKVNRLDQAEWALVGATDIVSDKPRVRTCYVALGDLYLSYRPIQAIKLDAVTRMAGELVKMDPDSLDGHRQLGEVARLKGNEFETSDPQQSKRWRETALAEFKLADSLHAGDARVLNGWADVAASTGDLAQAEGIYRRLIAMDPGDTRSRLGLADVAVARKDNAAATAAIEESLTQKQPDRQALLDFVNRSIIAGRTSNALPIVTWLANHGGEHITMAEMFVACGQDEQARRQLEAAIAKHDGTEPATVYTLLGELLVEDGLHDRARAVAAECLKTHPKQAGCQAIQMYENVKAGGGEDAERRLELLVSENPGERLAHLYYGLMCQTAGRMEDARIQFSLGLRAYPHDQSLLLARARLELALKEIPLARADALEVLKTEPAARGAQAILNQIGTASGTT